MVPAFGAIADGANILISILRGDKAGVLLSLVALIPIAGQAAVGGKLALKYADDVGGIIKYADDILGGMKKKNKVKAPNKATAGLSNVINKNGLTINEFNELRVRDAKLLTNNEKNIMKVIRESVEVPNNSTLMQKVIPNNDISKYLDGSYVQVGGYVTKYDDVSMINKYDDIYKSLRLDYPGTQYKIDSDSSLGIIRFKTPQPENFKIPYGVDFGGKIDDKPPFTGNGFTKAMNGNIVPEYKCKSFLGVYDGAELYKVDKNGIEILEGIFSEVYGRFMPVK